MSNVLRPEQSPMVEKRKHLIATIQYSEILFVFPIFLFAYPRKSGSVHKVSHVTAPVGQKGLRALLKRAKTVNLTVLGLKLMFSNQEP